jgi:hypothetical protein
VRTAAIPTKMRIIKTNMTDETNTQNDNEVQNDEQNEPKKTINGWSMNTDNTGYTDSGTPVYLGD